MAYNCECQLMVRYFCPRSSCWHIEFKWLQWILCFWKQRMTKMFQTESYFELLVEAVTKNDGSLCRKISYVNRIHLPSCDIWRYWFWVSIYYHPRKVAFAYDLTNTKTNRPEYLQSLIWKFMWVLYQTLIYLFYYDDEKHFITCKDDR